jgi:hypothetical protein
MDYFHLSVINNTNKYFTTLNIKQEERMEPNLKKLLLANTKILILGSYYPRKAKRKLDQLKQYLISVGFTSTNLVEDSEFPVKNSYLEDEEKAVLNSYYRIESSDFLIFLFVKGGSSPGPIMELQKCIDSNLYGREKKTLILMEQSFHKKQGNSKLLQGILKLMKDKGIFFHVFKDDEIPFDLVRKQIYGRIINPRL